MIKVLILETFNTIYMAYYGKKVDPAELNPPGETSPGILVIQYSLREDQCSRDYSFILNKGFEQGEYNAFIYFFISTFCSQRNLIFLEKNSERNATAI